MFTSAERMVTILINKLSNICLLTVTMRWIKSTAIYLLLGSILFLFSPSSISIVILYMFVLFLMNIVMTPIEWKFFQLHIIKKIALFVLVIGINILSIIFNSAIFGIIFVIILFAISLLSYKKRFNNIDWQRVTSACNYKLWNMKFISRVSKTSFKKDRQYSIWQRLSFWKKPFPYENLTMYHRLWFIYFEKNIKIILQFFGSMLLLLFVFVFINDLIFFIGVAFVIHAYTSVIASFYSDRFTTDIVQIIPWNVQKYKKTLYRWVTFTGVTFLLPFILYVILNFQYIVLGQLLLILVAFPILFNVKIDKIIQKWQTTFTVHSMSFLIGYGLLICLIISTKNTMFLNVGIALVVLHIFSKFFNVKKV